MSLDHITLKQARKVVKNSCKYYSYLPNSYKKDLTVICNTLTEMETNPSAIFDKNFINENLCKVLSEQFVTQSITPLSFMKKYKGEITWSLWISILCYEPLFKDLEEKNINLLDANFDYKSFLREMVLKDKLQKQNIPSKLEIVRKKI